MTPAKHFRELTPASGWPPYLTPPGPCNAGDHESVGDRCAAEVRRAEEPLKIGLNSGLEGFLELSL
jgi:hypothetical protein